MPHPNVFPPPASALGMCALCLRQLFCDVEAERPESERWNKPAPAVTIFRGTATCYLHLEDLYAETPITHNRKPSDDRKWPSVSIDKYLVSELVLWLSLARDRYGFANQRITYRLDGTSLAIYQDGRYRVAIPLNERPQLTDWADDDA